MDAELLLTIALAVGALVAWFLRSDDNEALSKAGSELGLRVRDGGLDGYVDDREVSISRKTRRVSENTYETWTQVEVKLDSVPSDISIREESVVSHIASAVGFEDLQVGDPLFDDAFKISCRRRETAKKWLSNVGRREALLELASMVDDFELHRMKLSFELPADPETADQLTDITNWVCSVAQHLDDGARGKFPPLQVAAYVREKRVRWSKTNARVFGFSAIIAVIVVVGGLGWYLYGVKSKRDAAAARTWQMIDYVECVEDIEHTWDADFSECEAVWTPETDKLEDPREARNVTLRIGARQAARIELDAEETQRRISALSQRNVAGFYPVAEIWNHGLVAQYAGHEDFTNPAMPETASSVDVLAGWGDSLTMHGHASPVFVVSAQCLGELPPAFGVDRKSIQAHRVSCATHLGRENTPRPSRPDAAAVIANLERSSPADWRVNRRAADPTLRLATWATLTAQGAKDAAKFGITAVELPELSCAGAWANDEAFGVPDRMELAAKDAPQGVKDRLLLMAGRQFALLGNHEAMTRALSGIADDAPEAICAAQSEVAHGMPDEAIARVERHSPTEEDEVTGAVALTLAEAAFVKKDWSAAALFGRSAARSLKGVGRDSAAIVTAVASAELGEADGLDAQFGEVLDDPVNAVSAARWFARAVNDETRDEADRWVARADLPLPPGATAAYFYLTAKLAPPEKAEFWLDIIMPSTGFDPLEVPRARRLAAELAGRTADAKVWAEVEQRQRSVLANAGSARLWRAVRDSHPRN